VLPDVSRARPHRSWAQPGQPSPRDATAAAGDPPQYEPGAYVGTTGRGGGTRRREPRGRDAGAATAKAAPRSGPDACLIGHRAGLTRRHLGASLDELVFRGNRGHDLAAAFGTLPGPGRDAGADGPRHDHGVPGTAILRIICTLSQKQTEVGSGAGGTVRWPQHRVPHRRQPDRHTRQDCAGHGAGASASPAAPLRGPVRALMRLVV